MRAPARIVTRLLALIICFVTAPVLALPALPAEAAASTRLLIVGDSISHGSASDYTWRYRLAKHLAAVAPGTVDFVGDRTDLYDNVNGRSGAQSYLDANFDRQHHALWGRSVSAERDTIAAAVASSDATTMTVLLGINDLAWLGQTPVGLSADMERLIANARSANPDLDIVLGHVLTRGDLWRRQIIDAGLIAEVNRGYDALAGRLSTDRSRIVVADTAAGWNPVEHTWDGVHPNSTGEVRIAAKFADGLSRLGIGRAYGAIPQFVAWGAGGGAVTARAVTGGITLNWTRTPGANAVYMEQRIVSIGEGSFKPLPVPLTGTTWTAKPLPAGWTIEYRAVPLKGVMVGHGGPVARAKVPGTPPVGRPELIGAPGTTQNNVRLWWTAVSNATGYMIEMCELRGELACGEPGNPWNRLPYPLPHPTATFDVELLKPGTWYRFQIVPVNGGLDGLRSEQVDIRTKGTPAYTDYFALGDSFSAGTGAGFDTTYCLRSPFAWPHEITGSWEASARMLACGGNTAQDVIDKQLVDVKAVRARGATMVTVTAGGNDAGFVGTLFDCLLVGTDCSGQRVEITRRINQVVRPRLVELYSKLRTALPGADIYAVGYPLLIDPDDVCLDDTELTLSREDKVMIRDLGRLMNDVIDAAADQTGVISVAYRPAERFAGHGACAGALDWDAWIHSFIPLHPQISFHPTESGYDAYGYAVNDARVALQLTGSTRYPDRLDWPS
jgi:lysophospholipase L1-like esterase